VTASCGVGAGWRSAAGGGLVRGFRVVGMQDPLPAVAIGLSGVGMKSTCAAMPWG
jgi:hypothetical protein